MASSRTAGHFQTATALCSCAGALFASSLSVCVCDRGCACVVRVYGDGGGHSGTADGGRLGDRWDSGLMGDDRCGRPQCPCASECSAVQAAHSVCTLLRQAREERHSRWATMAQRNDERSRRAASSGSASAAIAIRQLPPLTQLHAVCSHPAPVHCTTHTRADRAPRTDTPQRTATARTAAAAASQPSPVQPFPVAFPSRWTRVASPCR